MNDNDFKDKDPIDFSNDILDMELLAKKMEKSH